MERDTAGNDEITYIGDRDVKTTLEIDDLRDKTNEQVVIEGAVNSIRRLGNVTFIIIRTVRDRIQSVFEGDNLLLSDRIKEGDFVKVKGKVIDNPVAYKGLEIAANGIDVVGGPKDKLDLNLGKKELKVDLNEKLNKRVVSLRHLQERAVFKLQEGICRAFEEYLLSQRFTQIHSPKIVEAGAEGGANIFKLDYFGKPAYLAQSPQFYKQFMVPVYGRVFEVGPVFRAEKHNTSRHINEYTSLDFEMGFIDSFRDVMAMEAGFIKKMIELLKSEYGNELELLKLTLPEMGDIPAIQFSNAKSLVANKYRRKMRDMFDLEPDEEKLISKFAREELGSDFIFITNYPWKKRPFYTMRSPDDPNYTESFDLLFRGIEVTTGGQRIHDYDNQVQAILDKGLNPDDFETYLELHKNGAPPHGGCGIGLERLTTKIIGRDNVREGTLFPRDIDRLKP